MILSEAYIIIKQFHLTMRIVPHGKHPCAQVSRQQFPEDSTLSDNPRVKEGCTGSLFSLPQKCSKK
jgi:hypothetical protein